MLGRLKCAAQSFVNAVASLLLIPLILMHQPLQLIMGKFEAKTFLLKIVLLDEVIRTFNLES